LIFAYNINRIQSPVLTFGVNLLICFRESFILTMRYVGIWKHFLETSWQLEGRAGKYEVVMLKRIGMTHQEVIEYFEQ